MSAPLFSCTVLGKPVPQGRARTTRFGTFYPKTSKIQRVRLTSAFTLVDNWLDCNDERFSRPVSLLVEVAGMRANSDLTNHLKMVEDALVDAGVLAGDDVRIVREITGRVIDGVPRTIVTITKME